MYMHAFACMQALLHIEIRQDFSWDVHSFGTSVVLTYLLQLIQLTFKIHLISIIEKYHFCTGNGDEKYHPLQAEKTVFSKDAQVSICMHVYTASLNINSCLIKSHSYI